MLRSLQRQGRQEGREEGQVMLAGTFRSPAGATPVCCLRSVLSTWRKQGRSALEALEAVFAGQSLALRLGS
jgi:transposase